MPKKTTHESLALKEACVRAAREVIAEQGIENLSLRDVARKLGVSHQAPYKHYPSRDHLLAEVMRRCFEEFAQYLDARTLSDEPRVDLRSLGERYLKFATKHPLEYRLMFGTPWPETAGNPDLVRDATHAFDILRGILRRMHGDTTAACVRVDLDATYIWCCMHGLASITETNVMERLTLSTKVHSKAPEHVMDMIAAAMSAKRDSQ